LELKDFSSVFELLCGYNLINAINSNSEILKVLDFIAPVKDGIEDFKKRLKKKTDDLINEIKKNRDEEVEESDVIENKLASLYETKGKVKRLDQRNDRHEKIASNLYLIAGIFCFIILILAPFAEKYHKINNIMVLSLYAIMLFLVFLKCDYPPKDKLYKKIIIVGLGILSLFIIGSGFFKYSIFKRTDELFLVFLIPSISLLLFTFFRRRIVQRKIFKSLFIFIFLFPFIIPNISLAYYRFYNVNNECFGLPFGIVLILTILVALLPLIYDLVITNEIARKLNKLEQEIEPEYRKKELKKEVQENINKSSSDTNPISELVK
jgi:predicted Holliday junction resolvase-like endonuclease